MYIHIGGAYAVRMQEIIGIFDLENTSTSAVTRKFLRAMEEKGEVITTTMDLPKSLLVTPACVYITPVSPQTLEKRWRMWAKGRKDE